MKVTAVRKSKSKKSRPDTGKPSSTGFIGAERSGDSVTVSLEGRQSSSTGQFTIVKSTKDLPKSKGGRRAMSTGGWLKDPNLGKRLTQAFEKAVSAAKKSSAKLHK